jgi:hypothetical protein
LTKILKENILKRKIFCKTKNERKRKEKRERENRKE